MAYLATGGLEEIGQIAGIVSQAAADPALGEVVCLANQLGRISKGQATSACKKTVITPENKNKGLGLSGALPGLRGFVWLRENPLMGAAAIASAVGVIFLLGVSTGRR